MNRRKQKKTERKLHTPGTVLYDTKTHTCTILAVVNSVRFGKNGSICMNVGTINSINLDTGKVDRIDMNKATYRVATQKEKEKYFRLMYDKCSTPDNMVKE